MRDDSSATRHRAPFLSAHPTQRRRFALLDDRNASSTRSSSRLYTGYVGACVAEEPDALDDFCAELAVQQASGRHVVLLGDYEWGARLVQPGLASRSNGAALRAWLFDTCTLCTAREVGLWLDAQRRAEASPEDDATHPASAGLMDCHSDVDAAAFQAAIEAIHAALRTGECYQINYTFRLDFETYGSPFALYARLRERQPAAFGALLGYLPPLSTRAEPLCPADALQPGGERRECTPRQPPSGGDEQPAAADPIGRAVQAETSDGQAEWVLSFSPELFVRHTAGRIEARPMKGTAARQVTQALDRAAAEALARSEKNRAENLMIVDLLRNDLGRIAETGSVQVPALFTIEGLPTVWQMTSTVTARLAPTVGLAEVLRALFPCGSITGAPKRRAVELIDQLESSPRGLYTGTLGWLDIPSAPRRCGDFCLNVPIRTAVLHGAAAGPGVRRGRLGVGAGIVLDSEADDEWRECLLKGRFLTGLLPDFALFETLHASIGGIRHRERHLARLGASARRLGFIHDRSAVEAALDAACAELGSGAHRMRVLLHADGRIAVTHAPLAPLSGERVDVLLAPTSYGTIDADDPLLGFKTTRRARYDRAWRAAEAQGAFDMIFANQRGELGEGARSNVFVKLEGRWVTPPLRSGVLPGVMRSVLLEDPVLDACERVVGMDELSRAEALMVCNALRGAIPARLVRRA